MNTISHLIINAAIDKKFSSQVTIAKPEFLLGAIMPDIPLGLLNIGSYLYFGVILQQDTSNLMDRVIHPAFFNNPWWIIAHNTLHAPILLLGAIGILWQYHHKSKTHGHWWLWFFLGSLLHTLIDILTHVTDGPLLLFPFEWQTRFRSSISYWDPAFFGREFLVFEIVLGLILVIYLFLPAIKQKLKHND